MQLNSSKSYFHQGSIRNSAHDEEFFHCFGQYLDEAIQKLKDQNTLNGDEGSIEDEDFDENAGDME